MLRMHLPALALAAALGCTAATDSPPAVDDPGGVAANLVKFDVQNMK